MNKYEVHDVHEGVHEVQADSVYVDGGTLLLVDESDDAIAIFAPGKWVGVTFVDSKVAE